MRRISALSVVWDRPSRRARRRSDPQSVYMMNRMRSGSVSRVAMISLTRATFSVRIKDPDHGDRDFTCPAFFYWQAFNEARKYLLSAQR